MWAVRYERRCRVFEDIENACRFYHSIEPIDFQTQLLSDRTGIWESVAWKSPTPSRNPDPAAERVSAYYMMEA